MLRTHNDPFLNWFKCGLNVLHFLPSLCAVLRYINNPLHDFGWSWSCCEYRWVVSFHHRFRTFYSTLFAYRIYIYRSTSSQARIYKIVEICFFFLLRNNLPVLTNFNVTLLCDLSVSLNDIWVQSLNIPDEVAILMMFGVLEVPPPLAPPRHPKKLRCDFALVSAHRSDCVSGTRWQHVFVGRE